MIINPMVTNVTDGSTTDIFMDNFAHGIIHIAGDVRDEMAASVIAQLLSLKDNTSVETIKIFINSSGGFWWSGLAIYDMMKYVEKQGKEIHTFCLGRTFSMGAMLLSGGTKGCRYVLPHVDVTLFDEGYGELYNEILAENTDRSVEEIRSYMKSDYKMRAQDAVGIGIADRVLF